MILTIVTDDYRIIVDGLGYDNFDMSTLDKAIHAVQWNGEYGEVEYKTVFLDGKIIKPENTIIQDVSEYQNFIDMFALRHEQELETLAALQDEYALTAIGPTPPSGEITIVTLGN